VHYKYTFTYLLTYFNYGPKLVYYNITGIFRQLWATYVQGLPNVKEHKQEVGTNLKIRENCHFWEWENQNGQYFPTNGPKVSHYSTSDHHVQCRAAMPHLLSCHTELRRATRYKE